MRTYLLTFGIAAVLVVAIGLTASGSYAMGEMMGRLAVPTLLAALGYFWKRHPVMGYWVVFALIFLAMSVGARA